MIQITIHLLSIISGQLKPRFQGQELEAPSEKSQDQGAHFTRLVILTQVGTILLQKENLTKFVCTLHYYNNQNGHKLLAFSRTKT